MQCLLDSFREISNKSLEDPFQKNKAAAGISLVIIGVVLAIIGILATVLIMTGLVSGAPAFSVFAFPAAALLGFVLLSIGSFLLISRYKKAEELRNQVLKELSDQIPVISANINGTLTQAVTDGKLDQPSLDIFKKELSKQCAEAQKSFSAFGEKKCLRSEARQKLGAIKALLSDYQTKSSTSPEIFKDGVWNAVSTAKKEDSDKPNSQGIDQVD